MTAVGFSYFWLGGTALGFVVLPIAARGATDRWDRVRRSQRVVRKALRHFHRFARAIDMCEVDTSAYGAAIPDGPCVVVANHPTLLDVTLFLAEHDDLCTVVKGDLFRGPFVGPLLRQCGHIDAGEGTNLDGAAAMKASLDRLEAGFKVLVFPEGTRSPEAGMHQFKRGAFDLAVRAEVPLVPVLVRSDPPALAKGVPWWRSVPREGRFRLQLTPLPVMDWSPWAGRSRLFRKHVQALLRERVEAWHRERGAGASGLQEAGEGVGQPA